MTQRVLPHGFQSPLLTIYNEIGPAPLDTVVKLLGGLDKVIRECWRVRRNTVQIEMSADTPFSHIISREIVKALWEAKGIQKDAAKILGVSERVMTYRVYRHDLKGVVRQIKEVCNGLPRKS